jgi:hypothetical protein
MFQKIRAEMAPDTPSFHTLCPTRWTVRASSLQSVMDNYNVFMELWTEAADIAKDSETRARLIGVKTVMLDFDYLFGVVLGQRILQHTDNPSKTLQNPLLTASEAQEIAELTCTVLEGICTDEAFHLLWQNILKLQKHHEYMNQNCQEKGRSQHDMRLVQEKGNIQTQWKMYIGQSILNASIL